MSIDFTNPKPLYLQIADNIKTKIDHGQLDIGEQLASQKELANEYLVSLITVKKAIADLINEGILFSRKGFPYVMVSYSEDKSVYFVGTDHEKGGYIAAQHLAKPGYKKIGYINAEPGNRIGELRKRGFLHALREKNIEFKENFEYRLQYRGDWDDYFAGYEIIEKQIKNEFIENSHIILEPSLMIRESCGAKQLSKEPFFELKISK